MTSYWTEYKMPSLGGRVKLPKAAGVYVIYFDGRPVYVGQSFSVAGRIPGHRFRYGYARNIYTPWGVIPDSINVTVKVKLSRRLGDWAMWEIRLIARLQPEFNQQHLSRRAA